MFAAAMMTTRTENNAPSLGTTGSALVNLYFKTVRGLEVERLTTMMELAWVESPLDTLRIVFQMRDCRGGKGEKLLFRQALDWLASHHPRHLLVNLEHIPEYGSWQDIVNLAAYDNMDISEPALMLLVEQLFSDLRVATGPISLAAKWVPTSPSHKNGEVARAIAKRMFPIGPAQAKYRKEVIVPLRKRIDVVETHMCAKEWEAIAYDKVPSRCMFLTRKAFKRNDEERFAAFLKSVARGDKKIKGRQMFPHELVKTICSGPDPVIEEQWKVIVNATRELGALDHCLAMCDVSGSMTGVPMDVSIALGLLISEVTAAPFSDLVMTFSEVPTFFKLNSTASLHIRVQELMRCPWGMSTNFQAALDLILKECKANSVQESDMPRTLLVISDMQFNQSSSKSTNFEEMRSKYKLSGYKMPRIVFWNVRANTVDFPASNNDDDVVLVSGFSPSVLKSIMGAPVVDSVNPLAMLREIIDDERYQRITLAPDER